MFEWIAQPEAWIALATLMALEIVLGIDNIIFITILVGRLPPEQRKSARQIGLMLAMGARLALLFSLFWIMGLVDPLFTVFDHAISGRDIILLVGGLFLLAKSTHEIHASLEVVTDDKKTARSVSYFGILAQIAAIDVVFSLDSVITAVGLVDYLSIMVIAIISSVVVMMLAAKTIGDVIDANPTLKMLALSFLMLIGFTLMAEGLEVHVPKGYIYFAMAFSFGVELLNIQVRKRHARKALHLNKKIVEPGATQ